MPLFKVTHIGPDLRRHQCRVPAPGTAQAQAWAEQLYGEALVMSVIRVGETP